MLAFNFQSATCERGGAASLTDTVSGLENRAINLFTDEALDEIIEPIPPQFNVFFAGWNSNITVPDTQWWTIHHPSGAPKKVSHASVPLTPATFVFPLPYTHWKVDHWTLGTTERGSSGSPLFNKDGLIVGHLHGGFSACSAIDPTQPNDGSDFYGRFGIAWFFGPSPRFRLRDWLDPTGKVPPGRCIPPADPDCLVKKRFFGSDPPGSLVVQVLNELTALRDGVDSDHKGTKGEKEEKENEDLQPAISHLTAALRPKHWVDTAHLRRPRGNAVFNQLQAAVGDLTELLERGTSGIPQTTLQEFINRLVKASRLLVTVTITNARSAGGDPVVVAKAEALLASGDSARDEGDYTEAIEQYQKAWRKLMHASGG